jgi:hypothetical protein
VSHLKVNGRVHTLAEVDSHVPWVRIAEWQSKPQQKSFEIKSITNVVESNLVELWREAKARAK